uniref:ARAD1D14652p n=1 Tax=Blastobotrys adeninivorans TaxID=409370 RepID=A0A060T9D9_BLAAD
MKYTTIAAAALAGLANAAIITETVNVQVTVTEHVAGQTVVVSKPGTTQTVSVNQNQNQDQNQGGGDNQNQNQQGEDSGAQVAPSSSSVETSPTPSPIESSSAPSSPSVVSSSSSSPSASASSSSDSGLSSFAKECLDEHNKDRAEHSADPLSWNQTLADYAQNYLKSSNCKFAHSGGPYGENIAMGYATTTDAIQDWYNEYKNYDYSGGGFSESTGHFTQMVWKGTTQLGCAQIKCDKGDYLVCEYYPWGNVQGSYQMNVSPN